MAELKWFLQGKMKGNAPWNIPLEKKEILIGRSNDCALILQAPSVSRKHGMIRSRAGRLYIKDLGSRNGSFVNGVALSVEKELRHGDIIRLGEIEFTVLEEQEEEEEKTQIDLGRENREDFVSYYKLSSREQEVFYLLIQGLKIKEIGEKLFISNGTVKNHVISIYAKTNCHSRIKLSRQYEDFQSFNK